MNNNIQLISSISVVGDFEELVRRFVQKIFAADAYLVGGPWDGGRDLVYAIRGRTVKEALQISIQEKNLEGKLEEDLKKIVKLVDDHGYPSILYFFWSHVVSASREDKLKTLARTKYGITLEIYDAKKIAQKITEEYPDILRYLIERVHGYVPAVDTEGDLRNRALYEYLALSKDAANLRSVIVESQITAHLYANEMAKEALIEYAISLGVNKGKANAVISDLMRKNRINESNGNISLSALETDRIKAIEARDFKRRVEVLESIKKILGKYTSSNLSEEVLILIKNTYATSVEIELSELNFESPKLSLVKKCAADIGHLLREKGGVGEEEALKATHELISASSENEYLSNYCSSRLCIGLLNQKKLERYIENKHFFIYLDAPVMIRYLVLLRFSQTAYDDNAMRAVRSLRESINHLNNKDVRVTVEHFEETVRHLEHAEKISRFATDELLTLLGDSKNIFFNVYLKRRREKSLTYNFSNFMEELIGYEHLKEGSGVNFSDLLRCAQKFLQLSNVEVIESRHSLDEAIESDIARKYRFGLDAQRKGQTIRNDIVACLILSDDELHLDARGIGQTPMLITWDSTQHGMRNIFREKFSGYSEWLIYSPQRAIERLSMMALNIESSVLKDGVLAIIDEDYFKDSKNSLVDTLSIFLGEDPIETGAVVSLLTRLARRLTDEGHDARHGELGVYNTLNEVLLFTYNDFRPEFFKVRQLFVDEDYKSNVMDLLQDASTGIFDDIAKRAYSEKLRALIDKRAASLGES